MASDVKMGSVKSELKEVLKHLLTPAGLISIGAPFAATVNMAVLQERPISAYILGLVIATFMFLRFIEPEDRKSKDAALASTMITGLLWYVAGGAEMMAGVLTALVASA